MKRQLCLLTEPSACEVECELGQLGSVYDACLDATIFEALCLPHAQSQIKEPFRPKNLTSRGFGVTTGTAGMQISSSPASACCQPLRGFFFGATTSGVGGVASELLSRVMHEVILLLAD